MKQKAKAEDRKGECGTTAGPLGGTQAEHAGVRAGDALATARQHSIISINIFW